MSEKAKPPRVVGTFGASLMSVNGMIGAGIFAVPALLNDKMGAFAPWMFLIFGAFFACGTLISARLATMFRSSGGPQLYVQAAFGPTLGFQVGWLLVIAMAAGRAATLHVLVSYLAVFFPALDGPVARPVAVLALLLALGGLSLSGMRRAIKGLVVGTVLKVTPIVILCIAAFAKGGISVSFKPPDLGTFDSVALLVFFAYSGVNNAAFSAGEVRNPQRTLPISMLLSLATIVLFYMIVQWAYIAAGAPSSGNGTPLAAAANNVLGPAGAVALTLAAIFSIATNSLAFFVNGPRVIYGMAERGLLPEWLAHVSERHLTPDAAIMLFMLVVAVISLSGTFAFLAEVTSLGSLFVGYCTIAGFVVLCFHERKEGTGGLLPFWIAVAAVTVAFSVYAALQAPLKAYLLIVALMIVGIILGLIARRGRITQPTPILEHRE
ncbi:amino acid permease [Porphyrobacter algicida]|uniref:Amino acid permease n=1 Tax=Qipengyuania algicida TaxID=1836209 RepID=A0A845AF36_9SPHN|nr:APC family permease [Qipengyuania algicida]MXP28264.1 amino acid permease [Qipengyuania algicida]